MRTITRVLAAIFAVAIVAGCSKERSYSIVGTWRVTSITAKIGGNVISGTDENSNMFYEMKNDGTMIEYGTETKVAEYSYNAELGILTYRYSGNKGYSSANISFSNKNEFDWYEKDEYSELKMHLKRK